MTNLRGCVSPQIRSPGLIRGDIYGHGITGVGFCFLTEGWVISPSDIGKKIDE